MRKIKERENGISETEKYCQKKAVRRRKMSADELVNRIDLNAPPGPSLQMTSVQCAPSIGNASF